MSNKKPKPQWIKFFSRGQHAVLINDLAWRTVVIQPKVLHLPKFNFYKRDIQSTYFDSDEYSKMLKILKYQLKNNPAKLLNQLKKSEKIYQPLLRLAKKYNVYNWQKASDKEVKSKLVFLLKRLVPLFCFLYYPLWLDKLGVEILQELLKKIKSAKRKKLIWQITRPTKLTTREKFHLALLQLACQTKPAKKPKKEFNFQIDKIIKDFSYLSTYMLNIRFYSRKEIWAEIKYLLEKNPCQQRKEKLHEFKQQKKERQAILKKFSPQVKKIAGVLSYDVWLRDERVTWYGKIFTLVQPLFCEAAKRQGLTFPEFVQQGIAEIEVGNLSKKVLLARAKGYIFLAQNGIAQVLPHQKKAAFLSRKKIIKGQVANPGKAKGRVRIGTAYTFYQLKAGEVAVSGMTTPEATFFLKKAAAIVTDEGGVTCHAAIIARELNIPCIIGTKIATRVLKDRDRVEVDAIKGIVRKLK